MGLVHTLFSLPEVKAEKVSFLSGSISQDPLENFFGCQRQRGGTSDNPNVKDFSKTRRLFVLSIHFAKLLSGAIAVVVQHQKKHLRSPVHPSADDQQKNNNNLY